MHDIWGKGLDWDTPLWRYFRPDRFSSFIDTSLIYFAAATQFTDPFEGAVAVLPPDFPVDPRYAEMDQVEQAFYELKRLTKINCWHCADYESDAMWKLYAATSKGVAICSTPARLQNSLRPFRLQPEYGVEDLWGGVVCYMDLLKVRLTNPSMLERFFYKHKAFSWEREFRLAISLRFAEEFGVIVPEMGIDVSVNLDCLVEKIMIGPLLSESEGANIVQIADRAGLRDRLVRSSLCGRPRYV